MARIMATSFPDTTVVSCNGKTKIIYYATICHAYEVRTFVLYDLDGKGTDDAENALVAAAIKGHDVFTFTNSFESLLGIAPNSEHKASKVLEKIDTLDDPGKIPQEIKDAITRIAEWAKPSSGNGEASGPRTRRARKCNGQTGKA
jgi:hypothetical protein